MRRSIFMAALVVGCTREDPGTLDGPSCDEQPTELTRNEISDLGFSADDVLALAEGTHDTSLLWDRDGSTTPLALSVTDALGYRFITSEAVYPDGGGEQPAIGIVCEDRLEIDVEITFTTGDGAFDEAWTSTLWAGDANALAASHELDPDALTGTYDVSIDIGATDYDERSLWIEARFDAQGASGWIRGQISGEEDCTGNTCTAWAELFDVASWGGPGA